MKTTIIAIVICAAAFVAIEVIKLLLKTLLRPKAVGHIVTLIPVYAGSTELEMLARKISASRFDEDGIQIDRVILVDLGADTEVLKICKKLCNDCGFELKKPADLPELLKDIEYKKE